MYLAAEKALFGGYRAIYAPGGTQTQRQVIIATAGDVAATAVLLAVPVLTSDADIQAECKRRGVALVEAARQAGGR
ncbi:MAG TPA: hypothetical protein VFS21_37160 [Roseiflexaceae bacterium]|nr:hypothetical protein [Roseiflexaceae bacterium]